MHGIQCYGKYHFNVFCSYATYMKSVLAGRGGGINLRDETHLITMNPPR